MDGGMVGNDLLMQFQADLLDRPVVLPAIKETTAWAQLTRRDWRLDFSAAWMSLRELVGGGDLEASDGSAGGNSCIGSGRRRLLGRLIGWSEEVDLQFEICNFDQSVQQGISVHPMIALRYNSRRGILRQHLGKAALRAAVGAQPKLRPGGQTPASASLI